MNYLTNLIVYFVSTPSVYYLPDTWEPQPLVPVEMIFSTAVAVATLGVVAHWEYIHVMTHNVMDHGVHGYCENISEHSRGRVDEK